MNGRLPMDGLAERMREREKEACERAAAAPQVHARYNIAALDDEVRPTLAYHIERLRDLACGLNMRVTELAELLRSLRGSSCGASAPSVAAEPVQDGALDTMGFHLSVGEEAETELGGLIEALRTALGA